MIYLPLSKIEFEELGVYSEFERLKNLKKQKKRKFRRIYWLLIDLVIMAVVIILLLYRPARYKGLDVSSAHLEQNQVHPYLTHDLSPQLHNGLHSGVPFDFVVLQEPINEVISLSDWPKQAQGTNFSLPKIFFEPGRIVLMGTATTGGVDFIVTIAVEPKLSPQGLLNLRVATVKIGAMNITPLARLIAKKMYAERMAATYIDMNSIAAKVAGSLLDDRAFEPIFNIEGRKVRLEKITIEQQKLTAALKEIYR
jgi:hypothetical protein